MNAPRDAGIAPYVLSQLHEGVATLTLNRGERYNPLSRAMIAALYDELARIAADNSVRAVVITGAGKGFCAGHDLRELRERADPVWQQELFDACSQMMLHVTRMPQPVIARVNGIATAAGCQLVSMCDLAVAVDTASFALPGVNVGLFCSTPAVGVGRNISRKRTMELLLTGETIDAKTALAWGLVNRVVRQGDLDAAVKHFTDLIRARSARVIGMGKKAFYDQIEANLAEAYGKTGSVMTCNLREADAGEGIDAFLQKRAPKWGEDS
jgi:enoyl-CoA hydratase/carnithine racemase